jgi:UDP-glucose 4-epimerase
MPKYTRALVTGGAGFIGSHLVDALIRRHVKVFVVDDLSTGRRENVNPNAGFTKLSLLNPQFPSLLRRLRPEIVFHTAAHLDLRASVLDPAKDAETNIMGSLALVQEARKAGVKKIVFSSTGGPMYPGHVRPPWSEKVPAEPLSPYGISKRAAEMYFAFLHDVHGVPYVALRYSNVYGPRQSAHGEAGVVAIFTSRMLKNRPVTIYGDGKQTRDYICVDDVVSANMLAMQKNTVGIFNIGTGKETNVLAVFKKLKKLTGSSVPERHAPASPGELLRSSLDARKAARELGWKPSVGLDEGLRKTVEWFQKRNVK